jgi:hypothetical protein
MQAPKQEAERPHGENLYYIGVNDEHERGIAHAWIEATHPNTIAKFVTELRIDRLTRDHVVRALVRGATKTGERRPVKISSAAPIIRNQHGIRELIPVESKDLIAEVVECAPVRCADHWREGAYDDSEGDLNVSTFLEALGKSCAPAVIKWNDGERRGDLRMLRLAWA